MPPSKSRKIAILGYRSVGGPSQDIYIPIWFLHTLLLMRVYGFGGKGKDVDKLHVARCLADLLTGSQIVSTQDIRLPKPYEYRSLQTVSFCEIQKVVKILDKPSVVAKLKCESGSNVRLSSVFRGYSCADQIHSSTGLAQEKLSRLNCMVINQDASVSASAFVDRDVVEVPMSHSTGGRGRKSSLTIQFVEGQFVDSYDPTIENTFTKLITVNGQEYHLQLVDTAGQDEYSIFPQTYSIDINGYILVYSVTSIKSFEVIKVIHGKLLDMVGKVQIPIMLVGNKKDLHMERVISYEEGKALAESWNAAFLESSAKENQITLYEGKCFTGRKLEVCGSCNSFQDQGFLNRVNSICVQSGAWVCFDHPDFRGQQYILEHGEYPDFYRWNGRSDHLGSCRPIGMHGEHYRIEIFEGSHFRGPSLELTEDCSFLQGQGWDKTCINALKVYGDGAWVLYEEPNYRGRMYVVERGEFSSFNDWQARSASVQSIRRVVNYF
ncbi:Ras enriched in brain [Willisornis vidua]|uniref:Ras enriched in brain n=1 Tax=Willisornis vidua TaxID=1566151 RepID=A0ABQ9CYG4_9PASS|nr:Ras enriched in brain [Willisornis vidua]